MINIVLLILFVLIFIFNISKFKTIERFTYTSRLEKVVLIISGIIFIFIAYNTTERFEFKMMPHLIGISAWLFFVSGVVLKGIGKDGFHITVGRGLLVLVIPFEDIEYVQLKDKKDKDYFDIKIKSSNGVSYEKFLIKDREIILEILADIEVK